VSKRILRVRKVEEKTGLKKSSIYAMVKDGRFPEQIKLGPRASGWVEEEVDAWIDKQIAASRGQ